MAADLLNDWICLVETPQDLFPSVVSANLKTIGGKERVKKSKSEHINHLLPPTQAVD